MVEGTCFRVPLRLRASSSALLDLSSLLPPGFCPVHLQEKFGHEFCIEPAGTLYVGRHGRRRIGPAGPLPVVLKALRKSIQLCVAEHSPDLVFIHAGTIIWNGEAIIFPGRSFAGKSRLVWSAVQAGASYYSDEYALLDSNGFVHSFPVAITLREQGNLKRSIPIHNAPIDARALPGLLVFTEYDPHADWQGRPLSSGLSALRLLDNAVAARTNPRKAMTVISRIAACVPSYSGKRGEADTVTEWIRNLLGEGIQERPPAGVLAERMVWSGGIECY